MSKVTPLSKLTPRSMGLDGAALAEATPVKGSLVVARIGGTIQSVEEHKGNLGVSQRFKGDFRGTNLITGENFAAKQAFVPGIAEMVFTSAVASGSKGEPVTVVVDLTISPNPSKLPNSAPYIWGCNMLTEVSGEDPLLKLMAELGGETKQIEKKSKK